MGPYGDAYSYIESALWNMYNLITDPEGHHWWRRKSEEGVGRDDSTGWEGTEIHRDFGA